MEKRGLLTESDADMYADGLLLVSLSVAPLTVFKKVTCEEFTFTIKFDDNTFIVLIFNIAFNYLFKMESLSRDLTKNI